MERYGFKVIADSELPPIRNAKLANPQKIGEALTAIDRNLNKIEPRAVVDAARDEASALHPHFEWDDGIAAERYRLQQARQLVRCITILPSPKQKDEGIGTRPAFLSIVNEPGERAYRPLNVVLNNREMQLQVLAAAERDLRAWENRYRELVDICVLVKVAREKLADKRTKMQEQPQQ